ncbi:MAG: DUF4405 domain-containing protein [Bacteroidales bacterium]|nr:DUF4405 domain-containing protein [Bacteroidales bacterium]
MKKAKLNLIIDAIMLVVMMALIGVGLLNKYVLLTGQEKWEKFGENLEFYLWGFDRHDWNYIHFILGIILFGLLVLHIWFHWKMILNIYRNLIKNKKARIFTGYTIVFVSVIFLIFPIFVKPEIDEAISRGGRHFSGISESNEGEKEIKRERGDGRGERFQLQNTEPLPIEKKENNTNNINPETGNNEITAGKDQVHSSEQHENYGEGRHRDIPSNIDIMGSMTLIEVADKYNVPVNHIKSKLDIPLSTSNNERLGRLKRTYGFTMSDVEEIIYDYQKAKK